MTWALADVTRGPSILAISLVDDKHKLVARDPGMVGPAVELIGRDAGVVVGVFFGSAVEDRLMGLFY